MSPERAPLNTSPTQKEIVAMAATLAHDPGWIKTLDILCQKEELSVNDLRKIGFTDWMQSELADGRFAGWDVEDLIQLRELLTEPQFEESTEAGVAEVRRRTGRLVLAGFVAPSGVDESPVHGDLDDLDLEMETDS